MRLALKEKIMVICLAAAAAAYGMYRIAWIPLDEKLTVLQQRQEEVKGLEVDITPLKKEAQKLEESCADLEKKAAGIKETAGKTFTSEEFLVFLGKSAKANGVAVTGFSDLGIEEENGLYKASYDFSLKGSGIQIANVLSELSSSGIKSSVSSVSLRQNVDYAYLKRFFDDVTGLPWYKEPEEDEKQDSVYAVPDEPVFIPDTSIEIPQTETIPQIEPLPEQTPEPPPTTPPEEDKTIEERLNGLLENTSACGIYKAALLTNSKQTDSREMRLSITVCFFMFRDPAEGSNGIL